jgi:3',5'-cyclic AMP phosphodiesterase CpdA
MMRLLHFSDPHIPSGGKEPLPSLLEPKRVLGYANLKLHRESRFRHAERKLAALAEWVPKVDFVVCSGDYTALGRPHELAHARAVIEPFTKARLGFATVPGNHDVYLETAASPGGFDAHFGGLLASDRPDLASADGYPRVRLVGDDVAVVTLDSARPNPELLKSSGAIPSAQLKALRDIVENDRLGGRFLFVVTHYAVFRRNGDFDTKHHGLDNVRDFLDVCQRIRHGAVLHGHVHWRYALRVPGSIRTFCSGSATYEGREGAWIFEVDGASVRAFAGHYANDRYVFDDVPTVIW